MIIISPFMKMWNLHFIVPHIFHMNINFLSILQTPHDTMDICIVTIIVHKIGKFIHNKSTELNMLPTDGPHFNNDHYPVHNTHKTSLHHQVLTHMCSFPSKSIRAGINKFMPNDWLPTDGMQLYDNHGLAHKMFKILPFAFISFQKIDYSSGWRL